MSPFLSPSNSHFSTITISPSRTQILFFNLPGMRHILSFPSLHSTLILLPPISPITAPNTSLLSVLGRRTLFITISSSGGASLLGGGLNPPLFITFHLTAFRAPHASQINCLSPCPASTIFVSGRLHSLQITNLWINS